MKKQSSSSYAFSEFRHFPVPISKTIFLLLLGSFNTSPSHRLVSQSRMRNAFYLFLTIFYVLSDVNIPQPIQPSVTMAFLEPQFFFLPADQCSTSTIIQQYRFSHGTGKFKSCSPLKLVPNTQHSVDGPTYHLKFIYFDVDIPATAIREIVSKIIQMIYLLYRPTIKLYFIQNGFLSSKCHDLCFTGQHRHIIFCC